MKQLTKEQISEAANEKKSYDDKPVFRWKKVKDSYRWILMLINVFTPKL